MLKYKTPTAATLAAVFFLLCSTHALSVSAQVEVVELEIPSTRELQNSDQQSVSEPAAQYTPRAAKPSPASMTDFYFQLQTLQQEVQELRGLVEEQNFQLKKLKQQRLDDYLDLDRRVSSLNQAGPSVPTARVPSTSNGIASNVIDSNVIASSTVPEQAALNPQEELTLYRSGIDAVLKQRDYDLGLKQFDAYLKAYPVGIYAANAKYWMGQVYLQREDLENSALWFRDLINYHPAHQKTPEAQFKLGKILHLQGDLTNAQKQLKAVVASGSSAAKLAQDYLNKHF